MGWPSTVNFGCWKLSVMAYRAIAAIESEDAINTVRYASTSMNFIRTVHTVLTKELKELHVRDKIPGGPLE